MKPEPFGAAQPLGDVLHVYTSAILPRGKNEKDSKNDNYKKKKKYQNADLIGWYKWKE